jgi:alpha-beta hydrolase superfamily lysophospholipase
LGPARPVPGRPSELFVRSVGGFILLLFADGKPKKTKGHVFIG